MTWERLGLEPASQLAVWVAWCEGALLDVVPEQVLCPECSEVVNLSRPRGVRECVAETPSCVSVSDRCAACQTRLHFDATPVERRVTLTWPRVAVGAPLTVPAGLSFEQAVEIRDAVVTAARRRTPWAQ